MRAARHLAPCAAALAVAFLAPAAAQGLRITEYTYNSSSGEFVELTNLGAAPLSLSGWSIDDIEGVPYAYDLSPAGTLGVGESLVVTTEPAAAFSAAWGLVGVRVLGDNMTAKLSRHDALHVFDAAGGLVDRLEYGDELYEYTVRTLDVSAYPCPGAVGADDPYGWRRSAPGDTQGSSVSVSGDIGSPGRYVGAACEVLPLGAVYCSSAPNSSGAIAGAVGFGSPVVARNDFGLLVTGAPPLAVGYAVASRTAGFTPHPGGSQGHLCVAGAIGRLAATVRPTSAAGVWSAPLDLTTIPVGPVAAGDTWCFQLWFRDANPAPTSNFSDGLRVNLH